MKPAPEGLDAAQLARRRDAWVALADLFLDSEIRDGLPMAATSLAESGYSDVEIEAIFLHEVTPILHWNLKQVAGMWGSFDASWLASEIQRRRHPGRAPRALRRMERWVLRARAWPALSEFEVLLALVGRARALAREERATWALALGGLAGLYFERPSLDKFLAQHTERLQRAGLPATHLESLAARDLFPLFSVLRVRGFDPPEKVSRAQVEAAIAARRAG